MKGFWDRISYSGLEHLAPSDAVFQFRETILMNRISALMFALLMVYLPVEIIFNGWELVLFLLIEAFLMLGVLALNKKKYYNFSRYYMLALCLVIIGPMILTVPKGAGNEYFMIPASMAGVLFLREKWKSFVFMILVLAMFYLFTEMRKHTDPFMVVTQQKLEFFGHIFIAMIFLMSYVIVTYFKIGNEDYEKIIDKQRGALEQSNLLITEKNKEIIDSITYARRIQQTILPPEHKLTALLPDSFIVYKPKDIVAGDFYWVESLGCSKKDKTVAASGTSSVIYLAAADCTGHGVPGALVSMVCSSALNQAINQYGITESGQILDKARALVIETFQKNEEDVKDGMDISLCRFEIGTTTDLNATNLTDSELEFPHESSKDFKVNLSWSGANNPLWIIRKKEPTHQIKFAAKGSLVNPELIQHNFELIEFKPDKQPIGKCDNPNPFKTHKISLQKGDALYLFTDGFQDQFGGEKGKKYKAAQLKKLLLDNQNEAMKRQKEIIEETFDLWKGDLEQIDDVCMLGVKF